MKDLHDGRASAMLETDQPVESFEKMDAFIWQSWPWAQLQFVLAAQHYNANVPSALDYVSPKVKAAMERALQYMGLAEGQSAQSIKIDTAFIGSGTNSRVASSTNWDFEGRQG